MASSTAHRYVPMPALTGLTSWSKGDARLQARINQPSGY
jgi:hypothetical protein